MNVIKLVESEWLYLHSAKFMPTTFINKMNDSAIRTSRNYSIEISDNELDDIRDIFIERLQTAGFDEQYDLNAEGIILEDLIDKFFK